MSHKTPQETKQIEFQAVLQTGILPFYVLLTLPWQNCLPTQFSAYILLELVAFVFGLKMGEGYIILYP